MASLQDQLLKAGLVDEKTAKKNKKEKRKQSRVANKSKQPQINASKEAAKQAQADKIQRDRELNRQKQQEAEEKAIAAQIKQLIEINSIDKGKGEIGYNFVDGKKIKKIYVTEKLQDQLSNGRLAIVKQDIAGEIQYQLVPAPVAEKISQRIADAVVLLNDKPTNDVGEDDPYADYKIPDDLMW